VIPKDPDRFLIALSVWTFRRFLDPFMSLPSSRFVPTLFPDRLTVKQSCAINFLGCYVVISQGLMDVTNSVENRRCLIAVQVASFGALLMTRL
jgi:hypothetical protein